MSYHLKQIASGRWPCGRTSLEIYVLSFQKYARTGLFKGILSDQVNLREKVPKRTIMFSRVFRVSAHFVPTSSQLRYQVFGVLTASPYVIILLFQAENASCFCG